MLTLGERKLMVLQTESDFPFTQITYIFQNVNSPAFPLRVQLSGGCFAMGGFSFFSLNVQIWRRPPWLRAWEATLKQQQAGLWTSQCSLGREGCSAAHWASQLRASLLGHAHPTGPRAGGEQVSPSEHPNARHQGRDNPARPSKSGWQGLVVLGGGTSVPKSRGGGCARPTPRKPRH